MTERLPAVKPREVVSALQKAGWYVHRQKGRHLVMHKTGHPNVVVIPMHTRDVPKGTLRGILADTELGIAAFIDLLKR